jgi:hypothetical protein
VILTEALERTRIRLSEKGRDIKTTRCTLGDTPRTEQMQRPPDRADPFAAAEWYPLATIDRLDPRRHRPPLALVEQPQTHDVVPARLSARSPPLLPPIERRYAVGVGEGTQEFRGGESDLAGESQPTRTAAKSDPSLGRSTIPVEAW